MCKYTHWTRGIRVQVWSVVYSCLSLQDLFHRHLLIGWTAAFIVSIPFPIFLTLILNSWGGGINEGKLINVKESAWPSIPLGDVALWYMIWPENQKTLTHYNIHWTKLWTQHFWFCPHFSWAELKDLRLFLCTQWMRSRRMWKHML